MQSPHLSAGRREPLRVGILEDHHLVRQAVQNQVESQPDMAMVLELSEPDRLLESLRRVSLDLLLIDLGMDRGVYDPLSTIQRVRSQHPALRVVVLSSMAFGEAAVGALRLGVDGYILKDDLASRDLAPILRQVMAGERYFSSRIEDLWAELVEPGADELALAEEDRHLLYLAAQGHTNRQIAFLLGFSEKTVRNRFTPIFRKLGASNRVDAIRRAQALGLFTSRKHSASG